MTNKNSFEGNLIHCEFSFLPRYFKNKRYELLTSAMIERSAVGKMKEGTLFEENTMQEINFEVQ